MYFTANLFHFLRQSNKNSRKRYKKSLGHLLRITKEIFTRTDYIPGSESPGRLYTGNSKARVDNVRIR